MSCNNPGKKITGKKKIIVFSSVGLGISAAAIYLGFIATNNVGLVAVMPAILFVIACPAMCIGMGSIFWIMGYFSKNKDKKSMPSNTTDLKEHFCCELSHANENQKHPKQVKNTEVINIDQEKIE
jgi:hypothetical protein